MSATVCGWWTFTVAGFHAEALCALPYGHEEDHQAPNGDVLAFPANAERIGSMCADHDAEDSGTLCTRAPIHAGTHHNAVGYVWGDEAEEVRTAEEAAKAA
ncbi:hypothetical protein [Nocardiopsis metallicus]|uniref:Uncharacterized protein n=1 Tax=Nocardiopsis metallicus TaxID=179819 RepID=A0A840WAF0_9ACTN|nr:hypothetical protein [Nocardiopsis metallicus]MBB5493124.1 hypothetical protein [Nocardiopsis metallicus]